MVNLRHSRIIIWIIIPLCNHLIPPHTNIGIYNKCTNQQTLNEHIRRNTSIQFTFKQPSQINKSANLFEKKVLQPKIMKMAWFYLVQYLSFLFPPDDFTSKHLSMTMISWYSSGQTCRFLWCMPILTYTSWQDSFREMTVIHTRHGIFVSIMYMIHGTTGLMQGYFREWFYM